MKKLTRKVLTAIVLLMVAFFVVKVFSAGDKPQSGDYWKVIEQNYKIYAPPLPDDINLAGEKVPLENFDVREALDYEILKVMYWHSEIILYIKRANRYFPVVEPILKKYGVPDDFKYLLVAESGLKAQAVSYAAAEGWWQFKKDIGKSYGLIINDEVDQRYDLEKSTEAACKYLLDAYRHYGSWTMAAATYNMGQTYLDKAVAKQGTDNFYDLLLNTQTSRYVYRILAFKQIMQNPEKYGLHIRKSDLYKPVKTKVIKVSTSIPDLIEFARQNGTNYKVLKLLNPWLRSDKLTNKEGNTYYIHVPKKGARETN